MFISCYYYILLLTVFHKAAWAAVNYSPLVNNSDPKTVKILTFDNLQDVHENDLADKEEHVKATPEDLDQNRNRTKRNVILDRLKSFFVKPGAPKEVHKYQWNAINNPMGTKRTPSTVPTVKPIYVHEPVWVTTPYETIPKGAFVGGYDLSTPIYIGRGHINRVTGARGRHMYVDALPGAIRDGEICVMTTWRDRWSGCLPEYEVLLGDASDFKWVRTKNSYFLRLLDPVPGGWRYLDRKTLYICRVIENTQYKKYVMIGYVHLGTYQCWVPRAGILLTFANFEVLVFNRPDVPK